MDSRIKLVFGIGIGILVIGVGLLIGGIVLISINGISAFASPGYIFMIAAGGLMIFAGLMFMVMGRIQSNRLKMYGYPNVAVAYNYPGPNQNTGPSYSYQVTYGQNQPTAPAPAPYVFPQPYVNPSAKMTY